MLKIIIIIYRILKKLEGPRSLLIRLATFLKIRINVSFHEKLLINYLGSNHSKRLHSLSEFYKRNNNLGFPYIPKSNIENSIFIVGDSHSEYHGRNFDKINKEYKINFRSIWTGPNLLIDFCNNKFVSNSVIKKLKKIFKDKQLNIILCYGEIDLRVAFYRLLYLSKKFDNIDYLIKFYVESLEKKHANFQKDLNEVFKVKVNIFFKEITPPTNINGELPKNLDDLNKIMKNNEFPTLGNKIERAIWNKRLNDAISKSSIKKYFLTIPKSGYNSKGLINEKFSDNHHFTDDIYLQLCQKNFLQQIEKVILL